MVYPFHVIHIVCIYNTLSLASRTEVVFDLVWKVGSSYKSQSYARLSSKMYSPITIYCIEVLCQPHYFSGRPNQMGIPRI